MVVVVVVMVMVVEMDVKVKVSRVRVEVEEKNRGRGRRCCCVEGKSHQSKRRATGGTEHSGSCDPDPVRRRRTHQGGASRDDWLIANQG